MPFVPSSTALRRLTACAAALAFTALPAVPAAAHVTVYGPDATRGGSAVLSFRVPNESATQSPTVGLTVRLPGVTAVDTETVPGWRAQVTRQSDGKATEVAWTADPGTGIGAGQYGEFSVLANGLPDTDQLIVPAVQTYADGAVVRWDQEPGSEDEVPEFPAPTLSLRSGGGATANGHGDIPDLTASAPEADDTTARWLGIIGIVVGALGLLTAAGVAMRSHTH